MIGPHQSIIACFTSTGHGAAAWTTAFRLDTSYSARSASESLSMRTNIVGTNWAWVTWCCSMRASASAGSNRSITTTVPPSRCAPIDQARGAAW